MVLNRRKFKAMKPRVSHQKTAALTLLEVVVVVLVMAVLVAILLPLFARSKGGNYFSCARNLREIGMAYRIWAGDNGDKYPMDVSMTNGGAMELVAAGNVAATFQVMSNELSTPKIVLCPQDVSRDYATNFTTDFNNSRISYFVGADADEKNPQMFVSGDANFEISGVPVKSGLLGFYSNAPIAWSAARHKFSGNVALVDGSVQAVNNSNLISFLQQTGLATNRLAIP
jgi:prepilin-type processing-associated H-X9-DG protein